MKINVIGATGHLGTRVINELLKQGAKPEDIIITARSPEKAEDFAQKGVIVRKGDYDDIDSLVSAFEGTDVVLLIATLAPPEHRVRQHANAVEAAVQNNVKRIIFVGFITATSESLFKIAPFMLYAESKVRQSGLDWTILRDGMYLDPVADWIPELVNMGRLPYPVKKGKVAYISRDDLSRALAAACLKTGHEGKVYDLTGAEAVSMSRFAEIISSVTGKPVRFDSITDEEYAEICRKDNIPEPFIKVLTSMYWAVDNGEFEKVTDHVEKLTGQPPESIEDYLRRTVKLLTF